jgi:hypothetical protein
MYDAAGMMDDGEKREEKGLSNSGEKRSAL